MPSLQGDAVQGEPILTRKDRPRSNFITFFMFFRGFRCSKALKPRFLNLFPTFLQPRSPNSL